MSDYLFHYQAIEPTTWVYLSSLLMIGLFFKFGRLWSVRNLDVVLLILLSPGLVMVHYGQKQQSLVDGADDAAAAARSDAGAPADRAAKDRAAAAGEPDDRGKSDEAAGQSLEVGGFICLFAVGGLLLTRLLLDPTMVRRPLLEPNLSLGGLSFIGCSLFIFLAANVISEPVNTSVAGAMDYRISRVAPASTQGPGYALLSILPSSLSKSFCLLAQLGVIVGMVLTGYWHFRHVVMGIGAATLYLMLPYTSLLTGRIEHVLPAALLVGAVLMYRRPILAGILIGLASGTVYYPFFLLPLWLSFYWHRGFRRFLTAYLVTVAALALILIAWSDHLLQDLQRMFGFYAPAVSNLGGIWNPDAGGLHGHYRLPVLVAFIVLSISMSLWPAQKNLGTLMSCSAAIMVAAQFWHGYGGGTYMGWYLPLALLTIFRPNLEDRVAVTVLGEGWFPKLANLPKAA